MKLKILILSITALAFTGLTGCNSAEQAKTANPSAANSAVVAQIPAATDAGSANSPTGVAACDEYLTKVEFCLNKPNVPEAAKTAYRQSLEQNRQTWRQAAVVPQGKQQLEQSCRMALESAKPWLESSCK